MIFEILVRLRRWYKQLFGLYWCTDHSVIIRISSSFFINLHLRIWLWFCLRLAKHRFLIIWASHFVQIVNLVWMTRNNMLSQGTQIRIYLPTLLNKACKLLSLEFTAMHLHMLFEIWPGCEFLQAELACIWFLPWVNALMPNQIANLSERLRASLVFARVRLKFIMDSLMLLDWRILSKGALTDWTNERSLTCVDTLMLFKGLFAREKLTTAFCIACEGH